MWRYISLSILLVSKSECEHGVAPPGSADPNPSTPPNILPIMTDNMSFRH